ncbi:ribonuclease H-like domain-containing protein [Tanacetum coccineum]
MTHPHPYRRFVPQAVLTKSGKINIAGASVSTAVRPVNTAGSKPTVNHPRPISNAYKKGYLQDTRPFNKYSQTKIDISKSIMSWIPKKINSLFNVQGQTRQQKKYKEKGVIKSGCSRHMTRNKCYLTEYEDYDGGFVSFGDGKGRIFGKGKIKTDHKEKVIRCDNGTEFKNNVMNQFCEMKGIKREFNMVGLLSINGVAEGE